MSRGFVLQGGRVVDPGLGLDRRAEVRIRNGVVAALGDLPLEVGERVVDVDGLVVAPGLIDVHVHLREPGQEWKETVASGTAAAVAGGFTTIFCMPNTEPALDSVVAIEELRRRTDRDAVVNVLPIAAISERRRGRWPVDYAALAAAGAVGFSDDGESTADAAIMRKALEASRTTGRPVMVHCEEPSLTGGALHEGDISRELGIPGIPAAAEEMMIGRDLSLAELTGGWLHVCHVSTARGLEAIARARRQRVRVTAEVMPHHLIMTDQWVAGRKKLPGRVSVGAYASCSGDPDTKVNPPLRTVSDAKRLLQGLKLREIDLVATDHAPHAQPEKQGRPFMEAAFGLSGSEYALPTMLDFVRRGCLSIGEVIAAMSTTPSRLWRLPTGSLAPGSPADIVVFDPDERWSVTPERMFSRSANSPLLGAELQGRIKLTFVGGDERFRDW
jgi:dihydroorotase